MGKQAIWTHNCPEGDDYFKPGPNANKSVPASKGTSRNFTKNERNERNEITEIGKSEGCHTCGTKVSGTKSENFIPDHQPPNKLLKPGQKQKLYPHCKNCSSKQGGYLSQIGRKKK